MRREERGGRTGDKFYATQKRHAGSLLSHEYFGSAEELMVGARVLIDYRWKLLPEERTKVVEIVATLDDESRRSMEKFPHRPTQDCMRNMYIHTHTHTYTEQLGKRPYDF